MKKDLPRLLEEIYKKYEKHYLNEDPIALVHSYQNQEDQEIAGLITALLAFGNAKAILSQTKRILEAPGKSPYQAVLHFNQKTDAKLLRPLGHRWVTGEDLVLLVATMQKILKNHGSLKTLFLKNYHETDENIASALHNFSQTFIKESGNSGGRGFLFLFPSPLDKSPCKRLNMFLRWMVRPADGIDLGLWPEIASSQLIIPLDVHVYQFARRFKISRYKNPSWQMALDVTHFLKKLDPSDPVKFDFAICHYGMHNDWKNYG